MHICDKRNSQIFLQLSACNSKGILRIKVTSPTRIKKKETWVSDESCMGCMRWYCLRKILNSLSRILFNWFHRIHFQLILLTLLYKSLFFKTNLNCSYVLLLDIFSINTQWDFCKYVLSKKIKTDIFNKSVFANRKVIIFSPKTCNIYFKLGA